MRVRYGFDIGHFDRNEISCEQNLFLRQFEISNRYEFISPPMWTYSNTPKFSKNYFSDSSGKQLLSMLNKYSEYLYLRPIPQKWAWIRMSLRLMGIWTWYKTFSVSNENKTECINPREASIQFAHSTISISQKHVSPSECPGVEFMGQFLQTITKKSNVQHSDLAGFMLEMMETFSKKNRKWLVILRNPPLTFSLLFCKILQNSSLLLEDFQ